MIVWVIAGLLGVATGLRIGWALVNKQSVVSTAMIVALGSLGMVAALNWAPLTLLLDTALGWPNISIALAQVALTFCAAGSCVMITTVASAWQPTLTRRIAYAHYGLAAVISAVSLALFFAEGQQPEMSPQEYLKRNLDSHTSLPWLLPLLYVLFMLSVVSSVGMRYSSRSRRGRALFLFTVGIGLIVLASAVLVIRVVASTDFVGVGAGLSVLAAAMLFVAAGSLLPSIEDWFGARRELRTIDPLLRELADRHPDIGIGVRPRGPLAFRVAERMSLISDALFLEATKASVVQAAASSAATGRLATTTGAPTVSPTEQARAVAKWIHETGDESDHAGFPGLSALRHPDEYSDREWILAISDEYRALLRGENRPLRSAREDDREFTEDDLV